MLSHEVIKRLLFPDARERTRRRVYFRATKSDLAEPRKLYRTVLTVV